MKQKLEHNSLMEQALPRDVSFYIVSIFTILLAITVFLVDISSYWLRLTILAFIPFVFSYATGLLLIRILKISHFENRGLAVRVISYSLIGLTANSVFFLSIGTFSYFTVHLIIGYFASILIIYAVHRGAHYRILSSQYYQQLPIFAAVSLFCFAIAIWIQPLNSFPSIVGWDTFTYMLIATNIIEFNGTNEFNLLYLPTVPYFYAATSMLTGIDVYDLYWGSSYFLFPLAGSSLYLLGTRLSGNKLVGISTAVIGITIGSTNETLGFIFPFSSTFGLIATILANAILLSRWDRKFLLIYFIAALTIYHFALVANAIVLVSVLAYGLQRRTYYSVLAITSVFFLIGLYFGGSIILGSQATTLSPDTVWNTLSKSYFSYFGLVLIVIGSYLLAFRIGGLWLVPISAFILTSFGAMISGIFAEAHRLEEFIRPYIALIMGYGIGMTAFELAGMVKKYKNRASNELS